MSTPQDLFSRTLITGSNGMVGSYIDFGIKTDRKSLDVTDRTGTLKAIRTHAPRVIIHLAAETDVDRCEREPNYAYLVNTVGTYNVAYAAGEVGAKLVYVSTAGVFDGSEKTPYDENGNPNPQNYYGRSKYLGEVIVQGLLKNYIIARSCWMFGGGREKDKKFVAKILSQIGKSEIQTVNDQFGSPTFGKDLARGLAFLIEKDMRGIFHLSNKGLCTRFDMASRIFRLLKPRMKVLGVPASFFKLDAARAVNESLCSTKVDIMRPWEDALDEYLETEWKNKS